MNFRRISPEFLETSLKTMIPQKLSSWGPIPGNFSRIPEELQLQEMILEKFLGNSSKKVTMVGESGEIPHFCSLGAEVWTLVSWNRDQCLILLQTNLRSIRYPAVWLFPEMKRLSIHHQIAHCGYLNQAIGIIKIQHNRVQLWPDMFNVYIYLV